MSSWSKRILVADGDEIVVALLSHILQRQGYTIDVGLSVADVSELTGRHSYDAIVLDSKLLAGLGGFADRIAKTILLAPLPETNQTVHAVLQKPVEFGALVDAVAACVK